MSERQSEANQAWLIWARTVLRWPTSKIKRAESGKRGDGSLNALRKMFFAGYSMCAVREAGKRRAGLSGAGSDR